MSRESGWLSLATALGVMVLATAVGTSFHRLGLADADVAMVYLAGVVAVAARFGGPAAVLASLSAVLLFNAFFTRPYYTLHVEDPRYLFTFGVMLAVGLVVSTLTSRLREQVVLLRDRQRETDALLRLSRRLAGAAGTEELARVAREELSHLLSAEVTLQVPPGEPSGDRCLPLQGAEGTLGLLCVRGGPAPPALLEAVASLLAGAFERDRLAREAERVQAEVAAERTRSALLSTVSHDLRTPLASIAGASTALLSPGSLEQEGREDLLRMIADEARRLSRLVENLLQMTRLESGALELHRDWLPVDEVVGGALSRMEPALQGRPVETDLPEEPALVAVDGLLLEQALVNLVDNAVRNSPAGSPLEVRVAGVAGPQLEIVVADRGTGVRPGEEELIFQKFYRGRKGSGTGLGLAICRAVAEAHGGTIAARNRPEGGLEVTLRLPLSGSAPEAS